MSIKYECPCGAVLKIKEELAGTLGKCPTCKSKFTVPEPTTSPTQSKKPTAPSSTPASASASEKPAVPKAASATGTPAKAPAAKAAKTPPASAAELAGDSAEMSLTGDPVEAARPAKPAKAGSEPAKKGHTAEAAKPASKGKTGSADSGDDFDPVAFLLADGPKKPKALPDSPGGPENAASPATAPKPNKWGASVKAITPSAAESADQMLSPSANARDLLAKASQDGRARAATPLDEQKPGFDWAGLYEQIGGTRGLAGVAGGLFGISIMFYMIYSFVMGAGLETPPMGYVSGRITLNGNPVDHAVVTLTPQATSIKRPGRKDLNVRSSSGISNAAGEFTLMYSADLVGVAAGKATVTVDELPGVPPHLIPGDYQWPGGKVTLEVTEGASADLNIDLTTADKKKN